MFFIYEPFLFAPEMSGSAFMGNVLTLYNNIKDGTYSCCRPNNVTAHSWKGSSLKLISTLCELKEQHALHIGNFQGPRISLSVFFFSGTLKNSFSESFSQSLIISR